jgi:integrase
VPSLRKRLLHSGTVVWDIRYSEGGKQRSYHIGETDRRTAEKIFHKFCNNLAEGKLDGAGISPAQATSNLKLSDLAAQARAYAESNKSPKTLGREQLAFNQIIRTLGDLELSVISPAKIEEYKATRLKEVAPTTVNIEIRVLNTALNQAAELGWLKNAPEARFKQIRIPDAEPPDWLNHEQIVKLLATDDDEFRCFLIFLLHTGCRRNEALGVMWNDVDLKRRQIMISGQVGKMGRRRVVPLNDTLCELLSSWPRLETEQLFPNYGPNQVSMKFRRWARIIGLPKGISLHSLRATFACHLIEKGVDIYTVSKLLGHSSVRVTEKYYLALSPVHVQEAVNRLDGGM